MGAAGRPQAIIRVMNDAPSPEHPGRRGPGRPRLDSARLVETALKIVDEEGADALSMRALAERLSSSTATLYRHFPNRAALVAAVLDRVVGELDIDGLSGDWREWCTGFATGWFDVVNRHRNVTVLMTDQLPEGPNSLRAREIWLTVLLDNGFSLDLAARSATTLGHYVLGFVIQLGGERAGSDIDDDAYDRISQTLDPRAYPALTAAIQSGALPVPLEEEFAFGLELLLDSLARLRGG